MKTFKELREESGVSSSHAKHMLGNDAEKKAHSSFMQKKHGVKTTYHGSDELKYHGPKNNVKKALGTHYGGDHDHACADYGRHDGDVRASDHADDHRFCARYRVLPRCLV